MSMNLTRNAFAAIMAGDVNTKPLVQVVDVKPVGTGNTRYGLMLFDGVSRQHALVATQLSDRVKNGQIRKGSVIQLIDYISSAHQGRKIIVVLNFETIILDSEITGDTQVFNQPPSDYSSSSVKKADDLTGNSQVASSKGESYRPTVQPPYQPPPPKYKSHGAIMKNEAPARIIPIDALNPYQGRWAIKARVTAKSDIRRYNNARGDGKVFSFDLLDSDGGEIRATCFNAVLDKFYDVIEVGKVYVVSKGTLKLAQKNFNHLKNEWEILLESTSTVDLCREEDVLIPKQQFNFRPITEIESAETNSILDVIGVVISVNPSVPILRKNGMETQKRNINMKDLSGRSIELTLWGDICNREGQELQQLVNSGNFPVLAVKAAKVSDFTGKSLGTVSSTQLFINPDIPEALNLRNWFDHGGKDLPSQSISRDIMPMGAKNEIRKTISQIKAEGLGRSDKPDWITIKATLSFIKTDTFCYTACPLVIGDRQCNKKVTRTGNDMWVCERCNQEFEECDYRYLLQAQIQDHTGLTWITAFQETGEEILGYPAKDLYKLKHVEEEEEKFGEVVSSKLFNQYLFRIKVKEETYGEEQKVKITVVKADKVDCSVESRYLLDMLLRRH